MMTALHSGSPSKMIVLAPFLLTLLMANTSHHVHASTRGKEVERRQHRQLRQDGNGRQLMANTPNPTVDNIFKRNNVALPFTPQQVSGGTLDCTLPDTDFFGTATNDLVIVPYLFQATLVSNTPLAIINRQIAPNLDRGMVEGILPYFFPCASTGRRRLQLQASGITGISAQGEDIPLAGGLPCVGTQTNGDCLIFLGEMSVFVDGLTEQEAIEVIQVAIQGFIASGGPQSLSPFVLNSAYVTDDLQTLAPAPTRAPSPAPVPTATTTFSPILTPTPGPSIGFPTTTPGVGTTSQPTRSGITQPTLATPAPVPSVGPPSLTMSPSPFTPTQASPTIAPITRPEFPSSAGGNTFEPTEAPVGTPTDTFGGGDEDDDGGSQVRSSGESGIDKMDWWAWVLVGLAAVMALLCGMTYLNGAGGGAKRARPIAKKSSGPEAPDDDYQPPGVDDDYQPPGLGTFNIEPSPEPSPTNGESEEFYGDEEGEDEYEEEFEGDDEYGDEGVEYEEGEEFEGGEYGDEYGDEDNEGEFEEESYYEEETDEGSATPSFTNF